MPQPRHPVECVPARPRSWLEPGNCGRSCPACSCIGPWVKLELRDRFCWHSSNRSCRVIGQLCCNLPCRSPAREFDKPPCNRGARRGRPGASSPALSSPWRTVCSATGAHYCTASDATFDQLADPTRRPREPHEAIDPDLLDWNPSSPVQLDRAALLTDLRRPRKGAAPGPSGFTAPDKRWLTSLRFLRRRGSPLLFELPWDLGEWLRSASPPAVPVGW